MNANNDNQRLTPRLVLLLLILLGVLFVFAIQWHDALESLLFGPDESVGDPVLAAMRKAEQEADPYQRCLQYPQPQRVEWSDAVVEAFCADAFTSILAYRTIENRINDGRGAEVDAMFDRRLKAYFEGELAEQAFYNSYTWNFEHSNTSVRKLVNRWLEQSPDSGHARAALGLNLLAVAWGSTDPGMYKDFSIENREFLRNQGRKATEALESALELNPRIMAAYDGLIRSAALRVRGAQSAYRRATKIDPSGYYYRYSRLRVISSQRSDSHAAIMHYVKQADPYLSHNPRLVNLRTMALHRQATSLYPDEGKTDYGKAMSYWERAVAQGPSGNTFDHAAYAASKLDDHRRAVEFLSQILRFNPENLKIRRRRVRMLMELGQYDWVLEDIQYLLAETPKDSWPKRRYAEALIRAGKHEEAEQHLLRLLIADPDDEWLLHKLTVLYIHHLEDYDRSGEITTDWVRRMPENGAAWMLRAQHLEMSGRSGVHEAMHKFLKHGDETSGDQGRMMKEARRWLANHPKPVED